MLKINRYCEKTIKLIFLIVFSFTLSLSAKADGLINQIETSHSDLLRTIDLLRADISDLQNEVRQLKQNFDLHTESSHKSWESSWIEHKRNTTKTHNHSLDCIPKFTHAYYSLFKDGRSPSPINLILLRSADRKKNVSYGISLQNLTKQNFDLSSGTGGAHGHYAHTEHWKFDREDKADRASWKMVFVKVVLVC